MLSEQAVPVVRATLPAVGGALDRITERFYGRLFAAHPELLRDLFNRGNQANGDQRKALAGSIAAFAVALLEHPGRRPDAMLSRIAHKHASLGVASNQYKVVHEHLFAAIVEVLGDAVTPEVARAWDEVYWLMANALVAVEARLHQESGVTEGQVWRPMEIAERREETADTVSFLLRPSDGSPTAAFRPGQYVSVRVALPDGARQIRQYSLSSAPGRPQWRITVKRVDGDPAGEVSSWLHAHAREGDTVEVSAPFGDLVLPAGDGPLLLASAGIGSTPMLAMLDHLVNTGSTRPVVVAHADRAPSTHAHAAELRRLVDALPQGTLHLWYEEPGDSGARPGRADVTALDLPTGMTAYLCGPLPFLRAVRGDLLGRGTAAADIHYEVFGPDLWLGTEG
ncbi:MULTISPECIES: globin domain-containing protein [unclassified Streptomyces]|uniref:globin domain-containing protein n=1 Tax=unclassified Streptomyces TaxID=2593676 RepID=UPI0006AF9F8E|nr:MULTISPECIES: globin domain-containing protein [unclassified Streptomyces]KOX22543.1 hemin transporter [Streptomyces sp. NRRL F-6491]KOX50502.1 hemin transporter [Streptomyces sp. NRRL F-6492]